MRDNVRILYTIEKQLIGVIDAWAAGSRRPEIELFERRAYKGLSAVRP